MKNLKGAELVFGHGRAAGMPAPPGYEAVYHTNYNAHFGPIFARFGEDDGRTFGHFIFQAADHHLNGGGMLHGGVLMSLADVALGSLAGYALDGGTAVTVGLNSDFLSAGRPGDKIEIDAHVTRRTRSILFLAGTVSAERDQVRHTILTASGVWKIVGKS